MKEKIELNYDQKLTYKSEWWRYFMEYQYCVDMVFKSITGGEITIVSLPLAFLIRHTLELAYKMNLIELDKVSDSKAKIKYKGKSAHKIDDLHQQFETQMKDILKKFNADNETIKQFNELNSSLANLKRQIHKLDELSYSFRYPVESDGIIPNFNNRDVNDKSDVINFREIKNLYDKSIILLKYSTDVIDDIITASEQTNEFK